MDQFQYKPILQGLTQNNKDQNQNMVYFQGQKNKKNIFTRTKSKKHNVCSGQMHI